jgi:hypothetical protein
VRVLDKRRGSRASRRSSRRLGASESPSYDLRIDPEFVDLREQPDEALLAAVAGGLYLKSFRDEAEREDPARWCDDGNGARLIVAGTDLHEPTRDIHGFVVAELYPECRCGLLSYLAVESDRRRDGLGRKLVVRAVTALVQDAAGRGAPLQAVFAEIHDPELVESERDVMDPAERVSFWAKLLARKVPIPYVQPELRPGLGPVKTLDLISIPLGDSRDGATLPAETIRRFLHELYEGESNADLKAMVAALPKKTVELSPLNREAEKPTLEFEDYGIAFHFVSDGDRPETLPQASEQLASFERDLLAYSYREDPPFSSRGHHVPEEFRVVSFESSRELRYVSEGRMMTLVADSQRKHDVRVRASVTTFQSGVVVRHLVLTREHASKDSTLNEYDVIKLIKLWEGGEDVEGPFAGVGVQRCLRFAGRTIGELAAAVFGDPDLANEQPRTGTVQLIASDSKWDTIWRAAKDVDDFARAKPKDWDRIRPRVESLGGIVQGLVDFREIDIEELADVFAGVEVDEDGLRGLSKGTLLTIGTEDRALEVGLRSFGVSPYLLIPHAVLLQNEEQLHRAAREAQRAESRHFVDLEAAQMTMHDALDRGYLPNVFHYSLERALYQEGHESRGLTYRAQELRRLLGHVETTYDVKLNKRRGIADDVRNGLLLIVSYTSYRAAFPHAPAAAVLIGLIAISVLYLVWRWAPPTFWARVPPSLRRRR